MVPTWSQQTLPKVKFLLKRHHNGPLSAFKEACTLTLKNLPESAYQEIFESWKSRWKNWSTPRSSQLMEIVYSNMYGSMHTRSNRDALYFITFIDEYSRFPQEKSEPTLKFLVDQDFVETVFEKISSIW